jgi:hypothetical protein
MAIAGLVVTVLGFIVMLMGLGMGGSMSARMIAALVGVALSLFGIVGLLNTAYGKTAIWRK